MTVSESVRPLRHPVQLDASVRRDGEAATPCKVSDFSLDGCGISGFFRVGEQLEITIRTIGTFRAEVRWTRLSKAGARFVRRRTTGAADGLLANDKGTSAIEYAVLAAGIAVALVAALTGMGHNLGATWNGVDVAVEGTTFKQGGS